MQAFTEASIAARLSLLVSVTPMIVGIVFALRPSERWLALMRPLSLAAIFAAISNILLGIVNALYAIGRQPATDTADFRFIAAVGAEVMVLPFASFVFLTAAWLAVAIGMRKHA